MLINPKLVLIKKTWQFGQYTATFVLIFLITLNVDNTCIGTTFNALLLPLIFHERVFIPKRKVLNSFFYR